MIDSHAFRCHLSTNGVKLSCFLRSCIMQATEPDTLVGRSRCHHRYGPCSLAQGTSAIKTAKKNGPRESIFSSSSPFRTHYMETHHAPNQGTQSGYDGFAPSTSSVGSSGSPSPPSSVNSYEANSEAIYQSSQSDGSFPHGSYYPKNAEGTSYNDQCIVAGGRKMPRTSSSEASLESPNAFEPTIHR